MEKILIQVNIKDFTILNTILEKLSTEQLEIIFYQKILLILA